VATWTSFFFLRSYNGTENTAAKLTPYIELKLTVTKLLLALQAASTETASPNGPCWEQFSSGLAELTGGECPNCL